LSLPQGWTLHFGGGLSRKHNVPLAVLLSWGHNRWKLESFEQISNPPTFVLSIRLHHQCEGFGFLIAATAEQRKQESFKQISDPPMLSFMREVIVSLPSSSSCCFEFEHHFHLFQWKHSNRYIPDNVDCCSIWKKIRTRWESNRNFTNFVTTWRMPQTRSLWET